MSVATVGVWAGGRLYENLTYSNDVWMIRFDNEGNQWLTIDSLWLANHPEITPTVIIFNRGIRGIYAEPEFRDVIGDRLLLYKFGAQRFPAPLNTDKYDRVLDSLEADDSGQCWQVFGTKPEEMERAERIGKKLRRRFEKRRLR